MSFNETRQLTPLEYEACLAYVFRHPMNPFLHMELTKGQAIQMAAAGAKDVSSAFKQFDARYNMPKWLKECTRFEQTEEEIQAEIEQMKRLMSNSDMYEDE